MSALDSRITKNEALDVDDLVNDAVGRVRRYTRDCTHERSLLHRLDGSGVDSSKLLHELWAGKTHACPGVSEHVRVEDPLSTSLESREVHAPEPKW